MKMEIGFIIWLSTRAVSKRDPYEYPRGRSQIEPLAVVVTSVIMAVAAILILIQSIERLAAGDVDPTVQWQSATLMLVTVSIKVVLMFICLYVGTLNTVRVNVIKYLL